jgi:hypothetical protein
MSTQQNRNSVMTKTFILTCPLLAAAVLVCGCSRQPTIPAVEFGETVRSVLESQIHDHEAAIHPNPNAVEGSDAYRMDAALGVYRTDVGQPQEVQQPIILNTGNQ